MKRNEGGDECESSRTTQIDRFEEIIAGMALVKHRQHPVVKRLHGARHKRATRIRQLLQSITFSEKVLNFNCDIIGHGWMGGMKCFDDTHPMCRPIKKIWIAEGDVLRTRIDLGLNVCQHDVGLHDTKLPVVNRHNRTVPAQMPTPAARLGRAHEPAAPIRHLKRRVLGERGQAAAIGNQEAQPSDPVSAI
jgi:hypothetical protein